jgi:cell division protein FtsL
MATMTVGIEAMGTRVARGRAMSVAERNAERFEAQRRARRGPTPEVFFTKHIDNSRIVKADDPERRREMRMFTVVMSVLFSLVMIYVYQHFSSIEVGYKIEAQKTQVETLREKNRSLRLNEAQLTQPGRIDTIAKQLGLDAPAPGQVIRNDGFTGMEPNAPAYAEVAVPASSVIAR